MPETPSLCSSCLVTVHSRHPLESVHTDQLKSHSWHTAYSLASNLPDQHSLPVFLALACGCNCAPSQTASRIGWGSCCLLWQMCMGAPSCSASCQGTWLPGLAMVQSTDQLSTFPHSLQWVLTPCGAGVGGVGGAAVTEGAEDDGACAGGVCVGSRWVAAATASLAGEGFKACHLAMLPPGQLAWASSLSPLLVNGPLCSWPCRPWRVQGVPQRMLHTTRFPQGPQAQESEPLPAN